MRVGTARRSRAGGAVSLLVVVWLAIGVLATVQRHYLAHRDTSCAHLGTIVLTVVAGPLNYVGVNPRTTCKGVELPQPSK